ncbi:MAG: LysR family transcriptional regulator [Oscillospiraceae bacterium]
MTSRRLKLFIAVAEKGSISDVARTEFVSQASISQSISEIEKEYNVRLFERFSKKMKLTPTGQELLTYAKRLITFERALEDFLQQSSEKKQLSVGASLTIGDSIIYDLIEIMNKRVPDTQISVTIARNHIIQEKILNNELDVALGDIIPKSPDIINRPFAKDVLVVICGRSHRFWGRKSIRLEELAGEKLVVRDNTSFTTTILETQLKKYNIPYRIAWLCSDIEASKKAVQYGYGISTISTRLIQDEIKNGSLWPVEIIDANLSRTFVLMYHKDKYITDCMHSFMDVVDSFENVSI